MSLLVYNMWLSALFILHNNKQGTPERVVKPYTLNPKPQNLNPKP